MKFVSVMRKSVMRNLVPRFALQQLDGELSFSLFAIRYSPFTAVFGSAEASPSQISLLKPLLSLMASDSTKQTML